jgi:hypothetical protein
LPPDSTRSSNTLACAPARSPNCSTPRRRPCRAGSKPHRPAAGGAPRLLASEQLAEFYPSDEARPWLFSPRRLPGGQRPAHRIQAGDAAAVVVLLDQLRDGTFV